MFGELCVELRECVAGESDSGLVYESRVERRAVAQLLRPRCSRILRSYGAAARASNPLAAGPSSSARCSGLSSRPEQQARAAGQSSGC